VREKLLNTYKNEETRTDFINLRQKKIHFLELLGKVEPKHKNTELTNLSKSILIST